MRTNEEYKLLEYAYKIKSYCSSRDVCEGCIFRQSAGICHLTGPFPPAVNPDFATPCDDWFYMETEVEDGNN